MEGTPVSRCRRCDALIPAGRFVHCPQGHYQKMRTAFKDLELNYNGGAR